MRRDTTRRPEIRPSERSRDTGTPFITVVLVVGSCSGPASSTCIVRLGGGWRTARRADVITLERLCGSNDTGAGHAEARDACEHRTGDDIPLSGPDRHRQLVEGW